MALDISKITIADAVQVSPCSARLNKAFALARHHGSLPSVSLEEFRGSPSSLDQFQSLKNFGSTSRNELERLLKRWNRAADKANDIDEFASIVGVTNRAISALFDAKGIHLENRLLEKWDNIYKDASDFQRHEIFEVGAQRIKCLKLVNLILMADCSVGLKNAFLRGYNRGKKDIDTIGDFLSDYEYSQAYLMRFPTFGKTKFLELKHIIEHFCINSGIAGNSHQLSELLNVDIQLLNRFLPNIYEENYADSTDIVRENGDDTRLNEKHEETTFTSIEQRLLQIAYRCFENINLSALLINKPTSRRLKNVLTAIQDNPESNELVSLGRFFYDIRVGATKLRALDNSGAVTVEEFLQLTHDWMVSALSAAGLTGRQGRSVLDTLFQEGSADLSHEELDIVERRMLSFNFLALANSPPIAEHVLDSLELNLENCTDAEQRTRVFLETILTEREFDILAARTGLYGRPPETLETIASRYHLTRERIRQIELKARDKCNTGDYIAVFQENLDSESESLHSILAGNAERVSLAEAEWRAKQLSPFLTFLVDIVYGGFTGYYDAFMCPIKSDGKTLGWGNPNAEVDDSWTKSLEQIDDKESSLKAQIMCVFSKLRWPFTITEISNELAEASTEWIKDTLNRDFDAQIDGDRVLFVKSPHRLRLIWVLRDAGCELTIDSIVARHLQLFGFEITWGIARNTLAVLSEALIVSRGTYNLYENLDIPSSIVQSIADACYHYIELSRRPLSTKILYKKLAKNFPNFSSYTLNDYVILGILQDDERFIAKKGFMVSIIGIENFSTLHDDVFRIISEYGPISVADIRRKLSDTRSVLDVSIQHSIEQDSSILAVSRGLYSLSSKIFETEQEYDHLLKALKVNLLDGEISPVALNERLVSIGIRKDINLLTSIAKSDSDIEYRRDSIALARKPDWLLEYEAWRNVFVAKKEVRVSPDALPSHKLMELDALLLTEREPAKGPGGSFEKPDDLLGDILDEFGL